jgi:hypothetical protein
MPSIAGRNNQLERRNSMAGIGVIAGNAIGRRRAASQSTVADSQIHRFGTGAGK